MTSIRAPVVAAVLELLLVEDNPGDVGLLEECLRELDAPVQLRVAQDSPEAMRFLRQSPGATKHRATLPDLVLLDLQLPGMGGIELLAWIRSEPRLDALKVVMLTCSDLGPDLARCRELGASGYIVKAFDLGDLSRVGRAIRAHLIQHPPPLGPPEG